MKLIINTLLSVLFLQFLLFTYIKLSDNKRENSLTNRYIATKTQVIKKNIIKNKNITRNNIEKREVIKRTPKKVSTPNKSKIVKKHTKKPLLKDKPLKNISNTNSKVEKYAKKFLGNKYVWGATGPKTFDCSGFTQKVYKQCTGITIPRVSREQAKVGEYIKFSELKKGDMVFFDTTKKRLGKVNHVGIYLNNGDFIHASSGGKRVMITNSNKKRFYKNRFLWGRRIIQEHTTVATLVKSKKEEES
jgi:cell wall-associated NlpC family hydrolase